MISFNMMAPVMFGGLVVFLLIGFPVAFSLAAVGLFFAAIAIEHGYFTMAPYWSAAAWRRISWKGRASSSVPCAAGSPMP